MIKQDMTTNERMKRSDFMSYLSKQKKNLKQLLEGEGLDANERENMSTKLKSFESDYTKLDLWKVSDGIITNLKRIYRE